MKKTFLYMSLAVVLGVVMMLFPSWMYLRSHNEQGPIVFAEGLPQVKRVPKTEDMPASGDSNVQSQSTDASLQILVIGFIAAMVVYLIVRRRVHRPTYIPAYGTWRP